MKEISKKIRIALINQEKTHVWLTSQLGIHPSTLSAYLNGYGAEMSEKMNAKVMEVLCLN